MWDHIRSREERDNDICYSFGRAAGRQRQHPDDVLRQLMLAYVAARSLPIINTGRGPHDPVSAAAYEVAAQPPPLQPGVHDEEREAEAIARRQCGWWEASYRAGEWCGACGQRLVQGNR